MSSAFAVNLPFVRVWGIKPEGRRQHSVKAIRGLKVLVVGVGAHGQSHVDVVNCARPSIWIAT